VFFLMENLHYILENSPKKLSALIG